MTINIYVDGVYDLFHAGHVTTLKYIKNMYQNVILIVGLISDKDAEKYKRKPIINENNRLIILESCKYIDRIIMNAPLIIDKKFILKNNIDLVVHGFNNKDDENKQKDFFKTPIEMNKFKTIPYSNIESTTDIINRINNLKN
jgi:choline-phosphate cytidylyltransferase